MDGREEKPLDFDVVSAVKDFVFDLHDAMRRSLQLEELETLYTVTFRKLSDDYYKIGPWPAADVISNQCGEDQIFLQFYSEMRLRHMNVHLKITIHDRFEAWANYCRLFDVLLECRDTDFIITSTWAFDIINEFVYQDVWAVQNVVSYLHGLITKSNIGAIMEARRTGATAPKSPSQLHQMMGYYGLIGMSRLHCLMGDYHQCLSTLAPLDVTDRSDLFGSNMHAYVSLYMHMGLSFLMLKRYRDAARVLSEILVHISRAAKTGQLQKPGMEQIPKQSDKMMCLLAIASFLAPGPAADETILQTAQDSHRDRLLRMADGGDNAENAVRDLFQMGCPKFIVASVPDYSVVQNTSGACIQQQVQLFCHEMSQQLAFPKVRSYLKLYATISIAKMARFNGMSEADYLATLVSMKHKLTQLEWGMNSETSPLTGKLALALEFNYFVEDDTIVIDEQAQEKRYEKYFIAQISKCNDIVSQVSRISM
ncbi:eukaryotic translation initiation factor 3 subunit L eukaryotic translation initiation factor eIF3 s [Tribonema minus]|uniref:Eukaryotic translation initiation factor 3 subunit L n=1 Tax=Tribonema minus TaxID=303371 RepID=A0A835YSE4_9STRA|nr:eukaryotic translation initiation factor 3 subunit L eukaryotic translation initiation factor eIF3 s [Tribonema minus]